jgi:hypothetical protein
MKTILNAFAVATILIATPGLAGPKASANPAGVGRLH